MLIQVNQHIFDSSRIVHIDLAYSPASGIDSTTRVLLVLDSGGNAEKLLFSGTDAAALRFYFTEFLTPGLVTNLNLAYKDREKLLASKREFMEQQKVKQ